MAGEPISILGLSETTLRIGVFAAVFILFSALEALAPRRARRTNRFVRWSTNGAMLVLSTILIRVTGLLIPLIAASAAALYAAKLGFGLFNWLALPFWLEVILAMVLLDLAIWVQHLISHKIPLLWRLHRVHHADRDLDASSALRFHPIEMVLSALYKIVIVLLLGPVVLAVVLFEIILNASAMFNHANLALPLWLDRILRTLFVTPDMHRVHHSIHRAEHDHNYGFCLSIWDRLFRTYTAQPAGGHQQMTVGLSAYQDEPTQHLAWSLKLPLQR